MTESERVTVDKILRRLRKQTTAANGNRYTLEEVLEGLRREAYEQERAGAQAAADLLDASERAILALCVDLESSRKFGGKK